MKDASSHSTFGAEYAAHRAAEGRALDVTALRTLPYLRRGPLAAQWAVRARTFDAFKTTVLRPFQKHLGRALHVLDLGAGNCWLGWRAARDGHSSFCMDVRDDDIDGLGAASPYVNELPQNLHRIAGSFETLPLADACIDLAVFNASLHYALDLSSTLGEARRVLRAGGRVAILDSPFYDDESDGYAMVKEKQDNAVRTFGARAATLMSQPFLEFLTRERLTEASRATGFVWRRHRVRYPLWYELRPLRARLRGRRAPSRFDLWVGEILR